MNSLKKGLTSSIFLLIYYSGEESVSYAYKYLIKVKVKHSTNSSNQILGLAPAYCGSTCIYQTFDLICPWGMFRGLSHL